MSVAVFELLLVAFALFHVLDVVLKALVYARIGIGHELIDGCLNFSPQPGFNFIAHTVAGGGRCGPHGGANSQKRIDHEVAFH